MDFKVAGTEKGITALQMDIKIQGIPMAVMRDAVAQAREGRLFILGKMAATIAEPRAEMSPYAPRMYRLQIDPQKIGEDIGLWRPEITGGNWQKIKTSTLSWSDQGLRYYKGLAWYRQTVDVPAQFVGKRVFLWCGGVDETAKVWVNGQVVGISPGSAFRPFEMDATNAVKPGKNVITMCVANLVVNEVGTGGIVAPVMLYAPKDGPNAKLENIRDLKPTFP
jgi:hypothetical protein